MEKSLDSTPVIPDSRIMGIDYIRNILLQTGFTISDEDIMVAPNDELVSLSELHESFLDIPTYQAFFCLGQLVGFLSDPDSSFIRLKEIDLLHEA